MIFFYCFHFWKFIIFYVKLHWWKQILAFRFFEFWYLLFIRLENTKPCRYYNISTIINMGRCLRRSHEQNKNCRAAACGCIRLSARWKWIDTLLFGRRGMHKTVCCYVVACSHCTNYWSYIDCIGMKMGFIHVYNISFILGIDALH